eukprot:IDg15184t1
MTRDQGGETAMRVMAARARPDKLAENRHTQQRVLLARAKCDLSETHLFVACHTRAQYVHRIRKALDTLRHHGNIANILLLVLPHRRAPRARNRAPACRTAIATPDARAGSHRGTPAAAARFRPVRATTNSHGFATGY